jgi:peptidoglycan hydrolase-like protein with peptidoglycan-binding domain
VAQPLSERESRAVAETTPGAHPESKFTLSMHSRGSVHGELVQVEHHVTPTPALVRLVGTSFVHTGIEVDDDLVELQRRQDAAARAIGVGSWPRDLDAALACLRAGYNKACLQEVTRIVQMVSDGASYSLESLERRLWSSTPVDSDEAEEHWAELPEETRDNLEMQFASVGGVQLSGVHERVSAPLLSAIARLTTDEASAVLARAVRHGLDHWRRMRPTLDTLAEAHVETGETRPMDAPPIDSGLNDVLHAVIDSRAPCADLIEVLADAAYGRAEEGREVLPIAWRLSAEAVLGVVVRNALSAAEHGVSECGVAAANEMLVRLEDQLEHALLADDLATGVMEAELAERKRSFSAADQMDTQASAMFDVGVGADRHSYAAVPPRKPHGAAGPAAALGNAGAPSDRAKALLRQAVEDAPDPGVRATATHALRVPVQEGHVETVSFMTSLASGEHPAGADHDMVRHRASSLMHKHVHRDHDAYEHRYRQRPFRLQHPPNAGMIGFNGTEGSGEFGPLTKRQQEDVEATIRTMKLGPIGYDLSQQWSPGSKKPAVGADMLASSELNLYATYGGLTSAGIKIANQGYLKVDLFGFRLTVIEVIFAFEYELALDFNIITNFVTSAIDIASAFDPNPINKIKEKFNEEILGLFPAISKSAGQLKDNFNSLGPQITEAAEGVSNYTVLVAQLPLCNSPDPDILPNAETPAAIGSVDEVDEAGSAADEIFNKFGGSIFKGDGLMSTAESALASFLADAESLPQIFQDFLKCPSATVQKLLVSFGKLETLFYGFAAVGSVVASLVGGRDAEPKRSLTLLEELALAERPWQVANVSQTCDIQRLIPKLLEEWEDRLWCTQGTTMLGKPSLPALTQYATKYRFFQSRVKSMLKYTVDRYRLPMYVPLGQELSFSASTVDTSGYDRRILWPLLRLRDRNRNVLALQLLLSYRLGLPATFDGVFGGQTMKRVLEFQQLHMTGHEGSGEVDRATWEALVPGGPGLGDRAGSKVGDTSEDGTFDALGLTNNEGSDAIRAVQVLVNKYSRHLESSFFGRQTCTAAEQRLCGRLARGAIPQQEVVEWDPVAKWFVTSSSRTTGRTTDCVYRHQCYQWSKWAPGVLKADGAFGAKTDAMVRKFQYKRGLYPDGVVDLITFAELLWAEEDELFTIEEMYVSPYHEYLWRSWATLDSPQCQAPEIFRSDGMEFDPFQTANADGMVVTLSRSTAQYLHEWLVDDSYNRQWELVEGTATSYRYIGDATYAGWEPIDSERFLELSRGHLASLTRQHRAKFDALALDPNVTGEIRPETIDFDVEERDLRSVYTAVDVLARAPVGGWLGYYDPDAKPCAKSKKSFLTGVSELGKFLQDPLVMLQSKATWPVSPSALNSEYVALLNTVPPPPEKETALGEGFVWECFEDPNALTNTTFCQVVDRRNGTCAAIEADANDQADKITTSGVLYSMYLSITALIDTGNYFYNIIKLGVDAYSRLDATIKFIMDVLKLSTKFHSSFPGIIRQDDGCGAGTWHYLSEAKANVVKEKLIEPITGASQRDHPVLASEYGNTAPLPDIYKLGVQLSVQAGSKVVVPMDIVAFECYPAEAYCDLITKKTSKKGVFSFQQVPYQIRLNNVLEDIVLPENYTIPTSNEFGPGYPLPAGTQFATVIDNSVMCNDDGLFGDANVSSCCSSMGRVLHVSMAKPSDTSASRAFDYVYDEMIDPTDMLPVSRSSTAFRLAPLQNLRYLEVMNSVLVDAPLISMDDVRAARSKAAARRSSPGDDDSDMSRRRKRDQVTTMTDNDPVTKECLGEDGTAVQGLCLGSLTRRIPMLDKTYTLFESKTVFVVGPVVLTLNLELYGRMQLMYAIQFCPMAFRVDLQLPVAPALGLNAALCLNVAIAEACVRVAIDLIQVVLAPGLGIEFLEPISGLDPYLLIELRFVKMTIYAELCPFTCKCSGFLKCKCDYDCGKGWSKPLLQLQIPSGGSGLDFRIPSLPPPPGKPDDTTPPFMEISSMANQGALGRITMEVATYDEDTGISWMDAIIFKESILSGSTSLSDLEDPTVVGALASDALLYTKSPFSSLAVGSEGRENTTSVTYSFEYRNFDAAPLIMKGTSSSCSATIIVVCSMNGANMKTCSSQRLLFQVLPPPTIVSVVPSTRVPLNTTFTAKNAITQYSNRYTNRPAQLMTRVAIMAHCDHRPYVLELSMTSVDEAGSPVQTDEPFASFNVNDTSFVDEAEGTALSILDPSVLTSSANYDDGLLVVALAPPSLDQAAVTGTTFMITARLRSGVCESVTDGSDVDDATVFQSVRYTVDTVNPDVSAAVLLDGHSGVDSSLSVSPVHLDVCFGGVVDAVAGIESYKWRTELEDARDLLLFGARSENNTYGGAFLATSTSNVNVARLDAPVYRDVPGILPNTTVTVTCYSRFLGTPLLSGQYTNIITAIDQAGNSVEMRSNGILVDAEPPFARVFDTVQGVNPVNGSDYIDLTFAFQDRHSGVARVDMAIGTFLGDESWAPLRRLDDAEIQAGFMTIDVGSFGAGSDLVVVITFYVVDAVGNEAELHSRSLVFDKSPPTMDAVPVRIGEAGELPLATHWRDESSCSLFVVGVSDDDSAVSSVEVQLFATASDTPITPIITLDGATGIVTNIGAGSAGLTVVGTIAVADALPTTTFQVRFSFASPFLTTGGEQFYAVARATNTVNLTSAWLSSSDVTFDDTPPIIGTVSFVEDLVSTTPESFTSDVMDVFVRWDGASEDVYSGISAAEIRVFSVANANATVADELLTFPTNPFAPASKTTQLAVTLQDSVEYGCEVVLTNLAGSTVKALCSTTLSVDVTPPVPSSSVVLPSYFPLKSTALPVPIGALFTDDVSGVVSATVQLHAASTLVNEIVDEPVINATTMTTLPAAGSLSSGDAVTVTVEVTSGSGLTSSTTFDIVVDETPCDASGATAYDGPTPLLDVDLFVASGGQVHASASGFTDDLQPVATLETQWRVRDSTSNSLLTDWMAMPLAEATSSFAGKPVFAAVASAIVLVDGHNITVEVQCVNGGGVLSSSTIVSDGALAVPDFGGAEVRDGAVAGGDVSITGSRFAVGLNWDEFPGGLHGVDHYEWAVGTAPGADDVSSWSTAGVQVAAAGVYSAEGGALLPVGVTLHTSVRAMSNHPDAALSAVDAPAFSDSALAPTLAAGVPVAVSSSNGFLVVDDTSSGPTAVPTTGTELHATYVELTGLSVTGLTEDPTELRWTAFLSVAAADAAAANPLLETLRNATVSPVVLVDRTFSPPTVTLRVPLVRESVPAGARISVDVVATSSVGRIAWFRADTVVVDVTLPVVDAVYPCAGHDAVLTVDTSMALAERVALLPCCWDPAASDASRLTGYTVTAALGSIVDGTFRPDVGALVGAGPVLVGPDARSAVLGVPLAGAADTALWDSPSTVLACGLAATNAGGSTSATRWSTAGVHVVAAASSTLVSIDSRPWLPVQVPAGVRTATSAGNAFLSPAVLVDGELSLGVELPSPHVSCSSAVSGDALDVCPDVCADVRVALYATATGAAPSIPVLHARFDALLARAGGDITGSQSARATFSVPELLAPYRSTGDEMVHVEVAQFALTATCALASDPSGPGLTLLAGSNVSLPVFLDETAPILGTGARLLVSGVELDDASVPLTASGTPVFASLDALAVEVVADDPESGIALFGIGFGAATLGGVADVAPPVYVQASDFFVSGSTYSVALSNVTLAQEVPSGAHIVVQLFVLNGAGEAVLASSEPVVVDRRRPLAGHVLHVPVDRESVTPRSAAAFAYESEEIAGNLPPLLVLPTSLVDVHLVRFADFDSMLVSCSLDLSLDTDPPTSVLASAPRLITGSTTASVDPATDLAVATASVLDEVLLASVSCTDAVGHTSDLAWSAGVLLTESGPLPRRVVFTEGIELLDMAELPTFDENFTVVATADAQLPSVVATTTNDSVSVTWEEFEVVHDQADAVLEYQVVLHLRDAAVRPLGRVQVPCVTAGCVAAAVARGAAARASLSTAPLFGEAAAQVIVEVPLNESLVTDNATITRWSETIPVPAGVADGTIIVAEVQASNILGLQADQPGVSLASLLVDTSAPTPGSVIVLRQSSFRRLAAASLAAEVRRDLTLASPGVGECPALNDDGELITDTPFVPVLSPSLVAAEWSHTTVATSAKRLYFGIDGLADEHSNVTLEYAVFATRNCSFPDEFVSLVLAEGANSFAPPLAYDLGVDTLTPWLSLPQLTVESSLPLDGSEEALSGLTILEALLADADADSDAGSESQLSGGIFSFLTDDGVVDGVPVPKLAVGVAAPLIPGANLFIMVRATNTAGLVTYAGPSLPVRAPGEASRDPIAGHVRHVSPQDALVGREADADASGDPEILFQSTTTEFGAEFMLAVADVDEEGRDIGSLLFGAASPNDAVLVERLGRCTGDSSTPDDASSSFVLALAGDESAGLNGFRPDLVSTGGDGAFVLRAATNGTASAQVLGKGVLGVYTVTLQPASAARAVTEVILWDDGRLSDATSDLFTLSDPSGSDTFDASGFVAMQIVGSQPGTARFLVSGPVSEAVASSAWMPVDTGVDLTATPVVYTFWLQRDQVTVFANNTLLFSSSYGDEAMAESTPAQLTGASLIVRALDGGTDSSFYSYGGGDGSAALTTLPDDGTADAIFSSFSLPVADDPSCDAAAFVAGPAAVGGRIVRFDVALGTSPGASDILGFQTNVVDSPCLSDVISCPALSSPSSAPPPAVRVGVDEADVDATLLAAAPSSTGWTAGDASAWLWIDAGSPAVLAPPAGDASARVLNLTSWSLALGPDDGSAATRAAAGEPSFGGVMPLLVRLPDLAVVAVGDARFAGVDFPAQVDSMTWVDLAWSDDERRRSATFDPSSSTHASVVPPVDDQLTGWDYFDLVRTAVFASLDSDSCFDSAAAAVVSDDRVATEASLHVGLLVLGQPPIAARADATPDAAVLGTVESSRIDADVVELLELLSLEGNGTALGSEVLMHVVAGVAVAEVAAHQVPANVTDDSSLRVPAAAVNIAVASESQSGGAVAGCQALEYVPDVESPDQLLVRLTPVTRLIDSEDLGSSRDAYLSAITSESLGAWPGSAQLDCDRVVPDACSLAGPGVSVLRVWLDVTDLALPAFQARGDGSISAGSTVAGQCSVTELAATGAFDGTPGVNASDPSLPDVSNASLPEVEGGAGDAYYDDGTGGSLALQQECLTNATEASTDLLRDLPATYFVTVRAVTESGVSLVSTSGGVTIDQSPPVVSLSPRAVLPEERSAAVVTAEPPSLVEAPLLFQSSTTAVAADWLFEDPESGIVEQSWMLWRETTLEMGEDELLLANTSVGRTSAGLADSLGTTLAHGDRVRVEVSARNGAGLTTSSSAVIQVDTTPPSTGIVFDGASGYDADLQILSSRVYATWTGFADVDSGLKDIQVSVGNTPYDPAVVSSGRQVVPFESVGADARGYVRTAKIDEVATVTGTRAAKTLILLPFRTYYVCVKAQNNVGLWSNVVCSDGVFIDLNSTIRLDSEDTPSSGDNLAILLDESGSSPTVVNGSVEIIPSVAETASIVLPETLFDVLSLYNGSDTGFLNESFVNGSTVSTGAEFRLAAFDATTVTELRDSFTGLSEVDLTELYGDDFADPEESAPSTFLWGNLAFSMGVYDDTTGDKIPLDGGVLPEPVLVTLKLVGPGVESLEGPYAEPSPGAQLMLYNATTNEWINAADTCPPADYLQEIRPENETDPTLQILAVHVCHFSMYALFVEATPCPSGVDTGCDGALAIPAIAGATELWTSATDLGYLHSAGCARTTITSTNGPCYSDAFRGKEVLFRWSPEYSGDVSLRVEAGSAFATVSVFTDDICGAGGSLVLDAAPPAACIDNAFGEFAVDESNATSIVAPSIELNVQQGLTYIVVVSSEAVTGSDRSFPFDLVITPVGSCIDGVKNRDEEGVDCGGTSCVPCPNGVDPDPLDLDVPEQPASAPNENVEGGAVEPPVGDNATDTVTFSALIPLPTPEYSGVVTLVRPSLLPNSTLALPESEDAPIFSETDGDDPATFDPLRLPEGQETLLYTVELTPDEVAARCGDNQYFFDSIAIDVDYRLVLVSLQLPCPGLSRDDAATGDEDGVPPVVVVVVPPMGDGPTVVPVDVPYNDTLVVVAGPSDPHITLLIDGLPLSSDQLPLDLTGTGANLSLAVDEAACVDGIETIDAYVLLRIDGQLVALDTTVECPPTTASPTTAPTPSPTATPTVSLTPAPTTASSDSTDAPTPAPTLAQTAAPTAFRSPTSSPTVRPTLSPTPAPTALNRPVDVDDGAIDVPIDVNTGGDGGSGGGGGEGAGDTGVVVEGESTLDVNELEVRGFDVGPTWGEVTVRDAETGDVLFVIGREDRTAHLIPDSVGDVRVTYHLLDEPCPSRVDSIRTLDGRWLTFAIRCFTVTRPSVDEVDFVLRSDVVKDAKDDDDDGESWSRLDRSRHQSTFRYEWGGWRDEFESAKTSTVDKEIVACHDATRTLYHATRDLRDADDTKDTDAEALSDLAAQSLEALRYMYRADKLDASDQRKVIHKASHGSTALFRYAEQWREASLAVRNALRVNLFAAMHACTKSLELSDLGGPVIHPVIIEFEE